MKIALIAHDAKKELMVQFCSAYCGILSKHSLIATNTTGKQVSEATGLPIKRYLSGQGGAEQILALLSCNEVDVLLFFRDPINPKASDVHGMNLLRLCDVHNVQGEFSCSESGSVRAYSHKNYVFSADFDG